MTVLESATFLSVKRPLRDRVGLRPADGSVNLVEVFSIIPCMFTVGLCDFARRVSGADAPQRRMKECFLQLRTLPWTLPFIQCPKLDIPGCRWAPRSLSHLYKARGLGGETAVCTEDGLLGRYWVVPLRTPFPRHVSPTRDVPGECVTMMFVALEQRENKTFTVVLHAYHEPSRLPEINALLLVEGQLPPQSEKGAPCVAVSRRDGGRASGRCGNEPLDCQFVACGFMIASGSDTLAGRGSHV